MENMNETTIAITTTVAPQSTTIDCSQCRDDCFTGLALGLAILFTAILTALLVLLIVYICLRCCKKEEGNLLIENDPEKGKGEYAFDNPGFKEVGFSPVGKPMEKPGQLESCKSKWNQWSPLAALTTKSEKRKTVDDSALECHEVKVVALRSHDFTGLGFNICGNIKEGIYIKDVLHRGPASESGKLNSGDRINSVTISFEHIVYEDALTILSYASPYEVIIEARGGKVIHSAPGQGGQPRHPVYRSSSFADLFQAEKTAKRKLYGDEYTGSLNSSYSSLQKSRSNMTTLERKESKSPRLNQVLLRKSPQKSNLSPEQLKVQLEQRISAEHQYNIRNYNERTERIECETQKGENKHQKFGIRVLPDPQQTSPKCAELSQNENNVNIERVNDEATPIGIDEVDMKKEAPPLAKRREKNKVEESPEKTFIRNGSTGGSGIKRDHNGIPQEIPKHMLNAAVAARKNRRSSDDKLIKDEEETKTPKKTKGKAPAPPEDKMKENQKLSQKNNFDDIQSIPDEVVVAQRTTNELETDEKTNKMELAAKDEIKNYNSDSDVETDNQSSVNTIELNSSDITIHHEETEERQNRKTASTGDLTKIQRTRKSSSGTLERAQSLDITDSGIPTLTKKRKGARIEDSFDMESDEDLFGHTMLNKEPRLSLILDGLNTFQRNRLKKSTEWGNLEDAILKLNQEDINLSKDDTVSSDEIVFSFGSKSPEFDALVNKINEIKRESDDNTMDAIELEHVTPKLLNGDSDNKVRNQIWPNLETENAVIEIETDSITDVRSKIIKPRINQFETTPVTKARNEIWPSELKNDGHVEVELIETTAPPPIFDDQLMGEEKESIKNDMVEIPLREAESQQSDKRKANTSDLLKEVNHRRQQVPTSPDVKLLPPENIDLELETEIFKELNKNNISYTPEENKVVPEKKERKSLIVERANKRQSLPAENLEEEKEPLDSNSKTRVVLKNNPETGEICSKVQSCSSANNNTDEAKTSLTYLEGIPRNVDTTENFLFNERFTCSQDNFHYPDKPEDTNVSDDIKVSRHSMGSLERAASDDAKSIDSLKLRGLVSNVTVNNGPNENGTPELHSLELSINGNGNQIDDSKINENSDLYTTALDNTLRYDKDISKVTISTPDLIKNVTITEAINTLNNDIAIETSPKYESSNHKNTKEIRLPNFLIKPADSKISTDPPTPKNNSSLTYITEIQVLTPSNSVKNISEIEIIPSTQPSKETNGRNIDNEFEDYVNSFESNVRNFETNVNDFETSMEEFVQKDTNTISPDKTNAEKELHKIQEIAEEQLKKLPEMRFTTSTYETPKNAEKRQSQIELLRSNFERSPPKSLKSENTKSRIPIATTTKTPPMSPERRDSRNFDTENEKALLELMSSTVHSTPVVTSKQHIKSPAKNITVTSIRSNSKIPSGLPTLSGGKPPIPPRRSDSSENDSVIHVSSNGNISTFKQWVFDPADSVTNISVSDKQEQK